MVKQVLLFFVSCCLFKTVNASSADSLLLDPVPDTSHLWLPEVHVSTPRLNTKPWTETRLHGDPLPALQTMNLGQALFLYSPAVMKLYGPGQVATSSLRGATASQTALLWNGFQINSPLTGQRDFQLIPAFFFDDISIQPGGESALFGSGYLGGGIHLQSHSDDLIVDDSTERRHSFESLSTGGSFQRIQQGLGWRTATKNQSTRIRTFYQHAFHHFTYQEPGIERQIKSPSKVFRGVGMTASHRQKFGKHNLHVDSWFMQHHRALLPTIYEANSDAIQDDQELRITLNYQYESQHGLWFIRQAYFKEFTHFQDPAARINSINRSQQFIQEVEYQLTKFKKHQLFGGIQYQYLRGNATNFSSVAEQHQWSIWARYQYVPIRERWMASVSFRQEAIYQNATPFTGHALFRVMPFRIIQWEVKAGRLYRFPTLNDRFWSPGGNPNLRPEQGYEVEGTQKLHIKLWGDKLFLVHTSTLFSRRIQDWIQWSPGPRYWSPQNIEAVWCRGLETQTTLHWRMKKSSIQTTLFTQYLRSTRQNTDQTQSDWNHLQLIYTPIYHGYIQLSWVHTRWRIEGNHRYSGYRYAAVDHSLYLEPFHLTSFSMAFHHLFKQMGFEYSLSIINAFGTQYQSVIQRPMPRQEINLGLKFFFNNS